MEDDFDVPEIWDEFRWERFLQEQERNTEKYFELMEKYLDDPDRDQKIAREMGWRVEAEGEYWSEMDELIAEEIAEELALGSEEDNDGLGAYFQSPVYADVVQLHHFIEAWMEEVPDLQQNGLAVTVAAKAALCSAKLAAALSQEEDADETEIGMILAYLKRAMQAINEAVEAEWQLYRGGGLTEAKHEGLKTHIFRVRNQIVDLMREYRSEWQRRFGSAS